MITQDGIQTGGMVMDVDYWLLLKRILYVFSQLFACSML